MKSLLVISKAFFFCLCLLIFAGCKEEEEGEPEKKIRPPGSGDTNPPTPIEGKDLITIGNGSSENSPGYREFGEWKNSVLPGFEGSLSRYSPDPSARVTYQTENVGKDRYCVSIFRVTHSNSTNMGDWTLFEGEAEKHREVLNYKRGVSEWVNLGEFSFSGTKPVRLVLERHIEADRGHLRADEIRFQKLKEGYDCQGKIYATIDDQRVLDNKREGNDEGYREYGQWNDSVLPGFKDDISRYSWDQEVSVSYSFIPKRPNYCLSLYRVTHRNSVPVALVQVIQEDMILREFRVSHRMPYKLSGWVELDRVELKPDVPAQVKIQRLNKKDSVLRADAIELDSNPRHGCRS